MRSHVFQPSISFVPLLAVFSAALLLGGSALAVDGGPDLTAPAACMDVASPAAIAEDLSPSQPAAQTSAAGGGTKCCDPALEPGVGGNPLCFEGHTCCADGQWRCNNSDGTPSCTGGQLCSSTCGLSGATCDANAECCSGICKGNHRCR